MNQRIINKKLKKDILVNLWINQWRNTLDNLWDLMSQLTYEDMQDHESINYCRNKINYWLMDLELLKILKIGQKNHNIKIKNVYDYLLSRNLVAFEYKWFKNFIVKQNEVLEKI